MKKYIIICCCIVILGIVLVGLQWQISMHARVSQDEQSSILLDEIIRKGKIAITPSAFFYLGEVITKDDIPKDSSILTEEVFNMLSEPEQKALLSHYESQRNNIKSGELLLIRQPVESSMPVPPPLPPRPQKQESAKSMPQNLQDEIKKGIELNPVESSMPVPPPLPPRPQQQESVKGMPQNLQDEIERGIELKSITNQPKKPSLQDEIKASKQLKPAGDRQLADKPQQQITLQDEIKKGKQLKPVSDRKLADKPAEQPTLQDEIKKGKQLKPVSDRKLADKPAEQPTLQDEVKAGEPVSHIDMIKQGLQKKFKTDEDDEDRHEDDRVLYEPASVAVPQERPAANVSLLDQIKQGTPLKKVYRPNIERRPSSEPSSLSKQIDKVKAQQQQTDEEDGSESDDQSDWE